MYKQFYILFTILLFLKQKVKKVRIKKVDKANLSLVVDYKLERERAERIPIEWPSRGGSALKKKRITMAIGTPSSSSQFHIGNSIGAQIDAASHSVEASPLIDLVFSYYFASCFYHFSLIHLFLDRYPCNHINVIASKSFVL